MHRYQGIYLLIFSMLLSSIQLIGQNIRLSGRIIDDDTEEGVPFANVFIDSEVPFGTTADVDGNYTLEFNLSEVPGDTLSVASIGYTRIDRKFRRDTGTQVLNFRLKGSAYQVDEVTVLAGENPANEIIRQIIKAKERNKKSNFDSWQAERYTKTELDLNNIDPEMKDRKIFKEVQFIFENVDSVSDVRPFLPAYVAEQLYDVYYVKKQGAEKEILKAQKVSGINNSSVVEFIDRLREDYSIYDNLITMLGKEFISPFANAGLSVYEYYILDSTHINDVWSYKLKFKPKRKGGNTFYGDFWVSMEDYGLEIVNMRMSPEVNVNLVNRVVIYQEFTLKDSLWLPYKEKTIIDFATNKKENRPGVIGRTTVMYKDFEVNAQKTETEFKEADPEDVDYNTIDKGTEFWNENRHEQLSENEENVYSMVDSIKNVPVYKTVSWFVTTASTGYLVAGPVEIGAYWDLINYNNVEGWRFGLGLGTSAKLSKKVRLYGYGAYGFHDKDWKYRGLFQYVFDKHRRRETGLEIRDDVVFDNRSTEEPSTQGLLAGFLRRNVPAKILKVFEAKGYYHHSWKRGWSNRLALLYRELRPYADPFTISGEGFNYRYYANPSDLGQIDTTATTAEVVFRTRYAFKERLLKGNFSDVSMGSEYPIIELSYTAGIKGILNSQYNYHKIALHLNHWFYLGSMGWTRYRFNAGKIFGRLPFLLLEAHPGNEAFFYNSNSFNMMNSFEFVSDMWAGLSIVHHFDGFFLNRIPLIRKLKWRELVFFRGVWGTLSQENLDANVLNLQPNGGPFYGGFDRGPYMEAGVGLENIFKFIRVDALWRLNYWDNENAQKFSVRLTFDFYF